MSQAVPVPSIQYLQYVRGRFLYRRRIPQDARWAFEGKTEYVEPLPTVSQAELARLVQQHNAAFERTLHLARAKGGEGAERPVREDDIPLLARAYERELLATDEACRNAGSSEPDFEEWGRFLAETLARRRHARARGQFDEVRDGMLEFLEGARLAPSKDESLMRRLLVEIFDADLRAVQAELARHAGEIVPTPERLAAPGVYEGTGVMGEAGYFDTMYRNWCKHCSPGVKTLYEVELWLRRLCEFNGADPSLFASMLAQKPKVGPELAGRRLHLRDVSRRRVLEFKAHWLDVDPLHKKTIRKGLSLIGAAVGVALQLHPADEVEFGNPFHHLWLKNEFDRKGRARPRTAFEVEQLNTIFASRLFDAQRGPRNPMEVAMFWCLLLGPFSGLRLEELGHLRVNDLRRSPSGIWSLRIEAKNEQEGVKTLASERTVPLHDALVRAGFPRYVECIRAAGYKRVFPCLRKDRKGALTAALSKRLNRYLREVGVKYSGRYVYYSLRHTFKHFARECEISKEVSDVLSGHSLGGDASSGYGADHYPVRPLREAIERFSIPGLEIEHLYEHIPGAFNVDRTIVEEPDVLPQSIRKQARRAPSVPTR